MKKYNIIGDIHGRSSWKDLVRKDCINVFVGDYFSPYFPYPFEEQREVFMDIIKFKHEHPETILLIGNHDEDHWHIHERYSRFDAKHFNEIKELFEDNKDYFQIAYSIDNTVLVTHAGVSIIWYVKYKYNKRLSTIIELKDEMQEFTSPYTGETLKNSNAIIYSKAKTIEDAVNLYFINSKYVSSYAKENKKPRDGQLYIWNNTYYLYDNDHFTIIDVSPNELETFINTLWLSEKYFAFNFENNSSPSDCYGDSYQQGPLWIRPSALQYTNIFINGKYAQIVGHTQYHHPVTYINYCARFIENSINMSEIDIDSKIIYVDCLGHNAESIIYNSGNFEINRKN